MNTETQKNAGGDTGCQVQPDAAKVLPSVMNQLQKLPGSERPKVIGSLESLSPDGVEVLAKVARTATTLNADEKGKLNRSLRILFPEPDTRCGQILNKAPTAE